MKKTVILIAMTAILVTIIFGCNLDLSRTGNADPHANRAPQTTAPGVVVTDGSPFTVDTNPIISYDYNQHYSSDPAIEVLKNVSVDNGKTYRDLLVMVTSTDLRKEGDNEWTMNGTHLYATFGDNNLRTTWYEYGNPLGTGIIDESAFSQWIKQDPQPHRMFAPDIQLVPSIVLPNQSRFYLYIPDHDADGVWHIGVAHANVMSNNNFYDTFIAENASPTDYFQIQDVPKDAVITEPGDPGVFYAEVKKKYYMTYTDSNLPNKKDKVVNIGMAEINSDPTSSSYMKSGKYLGKISFGDPMNPLFDYTVQKYGGLNKYMEGPDICKMSTAQNYTYYYLVFTAKVDTDKFDSSYIGYAMAKPSEFAGNPTGCWKFKGWIFRNFNDVSSNHADLVEFNNRHYIFHNRVLPDDIPNERKNGNHRQVCCKEIELVDHPGYDDDGTIVGVSIPPLTDVGKKYFFTSLDGQTKSISKGYVHIKDEAIGDPDGKAAVRISSLKNITGVSWGFLNNIRLYYYLDIEPGSNLSIDTSKMNKFALATPPLKHIGGRTWAVVIRFKDLVGNGPEPGETFNTEGDLITLSYDVNTSPAKILFPGGFPYTWRVPYDKKNDFSQPIGDYNTWTTRIALFAASSDPLTAEPISGEKTGKECLPENADTIYLRTEHLDKNNKYTYLSSMSTDDNSGVNNQYLNTGWTSQEWIFEDVPQYTYIGQSKSNKPIYAPQNAVRIKNKWTNKYLTCNDQIDRGGQMSDHYYWTLNQTLRSDWTTQIWIKEAIQNENHSYRLRSLWQYATSKDVTPFTDNLYLTLCISGSDKDTQSVYVQELRSDWSTQKWIMD